jgi:hypothetical protein
MSPNMKSKKQSEILEILKRNNGKMMSVPLYTKLAEKYGTMEKTFWGYLSALKAEGKVDYPNNIKTCADFEITMEK